MLTYSFANIGKIPLYEYLYRCIRRDIQSGRLRAGEKLPSKRALARNLGISTITVEGAYGQLTAEGYCQSVPKKGFFVAAGVEKELPVMKVKAVNRPIIKNTEPKSWRFDFVADTVCSDDFPFTIWTRLLRQVVNEKADALLKRSPGFGIRELREAIAKHLQNFRGLVAVPEQIIIGAGTEYLYSLLVQVLGRDKRYCVENPGYDRIRKIYESNGAECVLADMDDQGIKLAAIEAKQADIIHISPSHHFPTGIIMPVNRRYELLGWASSGENRYIIEDDYDSEFRMSGKPIPTMMGIDVSGRVIYMNTFSKSLTPTIRISYMVLPPELVNLFYKKIGFYSCTVSNFEQYTLAKFLEGGHFERHINRMRNIYRKRRAKLLELLQPYEKSGRIDIIERGSGLHFLLRIHTKLSNDSIIAKLAKRGIHIRALADYYADENPAAQHVFVVNYSGIAAEDLKAGLFADIADC